MKTKAKLEERSYFFYIKKEDIDENEFSSLDVKRINTKKVSYLTEDMSNKEILSSYAEKLLETRRNIVNFFEENPDILIDIAFNKVSMKILANDLRYLRNPEVDAVAFNRQACSVIATYKQIFSKIEYYYKKKKHKDSEENINMRKFLVKIWKFTKEEMIEELRKIQSSLKSEKKMKLYDRYIYLLQKDKTLFEKIHKVQLIWIKNHSSFSPKSLTFQTMNDLTNPQSFLTRISKKKVMITINIPNVGIFHFPTKYNRKYHGLFSEYEDTKTTRDKKTGRFTKSQHTFTLKFLTNGDLKVIVTKPVKTEKVSYTEIPSPEKIAGIDLNSRDNRMYLSTNKIIPLDNFLIDKEKKLEISLENHDKNCDLRKQEKVHGKSLKLQEEKQKRRREFSANFAVHQALSLLQEENIEMVVLEDLSIRGTKGYKKKSTTEADMKYKHIQRALMMDTIKNIFIRLGHKYGISIALTNSRFTSRECSHCHKIDEKNRNKDRYSCSCGYQENADYNASLNIRDRMSNPRKREKLQRLSKVENIWMWKGKNYKNQKEYEIA